MKYPFNKERAVAGEPVVTRDGLKVTFVRNEYDEHFPLLFMSENDTPIWVTECGSFNYNVTSEHGHDLFMLTPDPQPSAPIPFDWNKYNSGEWEVKYRNDKKPRAVYATPEARDFVIISIDDEGNVLSHLDNGMFYDSKKEHGYDLLLITKEVTRWFNVYRDKDGTLKTGIECSSEEMAKAAMRGNNRYVGTYSFTTKAKS